MFLCKKALSALSSKTLPLAIVAVAAVILGLVWLGAGAAEARGRSVTLNHNKLTITTPASNNGNGPCRLQSLVEWEPLGHRVEVEILLQKRSGSFPTWTSVQALPGKANSASVDWDDVAPGYQYRQWFQIYSVKGKDGASAAPANLKSSIKDNCSQGQ